LPESTALVLVRTRNTGRNVVLRAAAGADWALVKLFDLPKGDALVRWIRGGPRLRRARSLWKPPRRWPRWKMTRARWATNQQLLTYVNFARPVELEDVQTSPRPGRGQGLRHGRRIGQRRRPAGPARAAQLLESAEPLYALSMIVRQYRLLALARAKCARARQRGDISKSLWPAPVSTGKICARPRNFKLGDLKLFTGACFNRC